MAEEFKIQVGVDTTKAESDLDSFVNKKRKMVVEPEIDTKSFEKGIDDAIGKTQKQTKKKPVEMEVEYKTNKNSISQLKNDAEKVFRLFSVMGTLDFGSDKIKEAIGNLKELDTTLTEISKTGNLTENQLTKLGNNAFANASKWGALVQDYMDSNETFAQAGFKNIEQMSDLSTMAQMAGNMTADTSTKFLIASDAAWQMNGNVEKLNSTLDGMNMITNRNALQMTDLANGIRVAGSMLANSGLAEDQASSLLGTGIATTKESGETVARGLRTIIMNLRQVKGETEDGEIIDDEKLKKVEQTCKDVGVSLKTVKDGIVELRNPVDVLRDLSEIYNSLDKMDARRAQITDDIAGKHRANILSSILTNFEMYDKMVQDYSEGSGSAFNEAMKTADSWEGRLNSLSNSWTEFVSGFVSTDFAKDSISGLESMIHIFDNLNEAQLFIPSFLSSMMALQSVFKGKGITDVSIAKDGMGALGKLDIQGNLFGIDFTKIGQWKKHFAEAESEIARWNKSCLSGHTNVKKFGSSLAKEDKNFKKYITNTKDGTASLDGYKKSLAEAGEQFQKFSMKSVLANAATGFLIGAGIELAVAGIAKVTDELTHAQENAIAKGQETASNFEQQKQSLESMSSTISNSGERFVELGKGVDSFGNNLSLTTAEFEEYNQLAKEIGATLPNLVSGYTSLGTPIINTANNIDKLNEALAEQKRILNEDMIGKAKDYTDSFNAKYNNNGTEFGAELGLKQQKQQLDAFVKSFDDTKDMKNALEEMGKISYTFDGKKLPTSDVNEKYYSLEYLKNAKNELKGIAKELDIDIFGSFGKIDEKKLKENFPKIKSYLTDLERQSETALQEMKPLFQAYLENSGDYSGLPDNIKSAVNSIVSSIDTEFVDANFLKDNGDFDKGSFEKWANNLTKDLSKADVQDKFSKLFEIDSKKAGMTFSDYKNQMGDLINYLSDNVDGLSKEHLSKMFEFDKEGLQDFTANYDAVVGKFGEKAEALSNTDLELGKLILDDGFSGTYEEFSEKLYLAKKAKEDLNATPLMDDYAKAKETKNAGDNYKTMLSEYEQIKKDHKAGLVGTDDYKTFAKWVSPTGADDPKNFQENMPKFERYFTESSKGAQNLLNDLKAIGKADVVDGKWKWQIDDLEETAKQLGIGLEPMLAIFGRLNDYGFSNNFVSSLEQGKKHLTDLYGELVQSEARLKELESTNQNGMNNHAIDAEKAKIEGLKASIEETNTAMSALSKKSAEDYANQVASAKQAITSLKEERDKILKDNTYGDDTKEVVAMMDSQIKQWASENGIELDAELNIVNKEETKKEIEEDLESKPVETEVNYKSNVDELKEKASAVIDDVQKMTSELSPVSLDLESTDTDNIKKQIEVVEAALMGFRDKKGVVDISTEGAQEAIDVLNALYAQKSLVSGQVLMSIDTSKLEGDVANVIAKLQEFQQAYNELQRLNTLAEAGVKVDTTEAETKLANITSELQNLPEGQAEILAKLIPDPSTSQTISSSISAITPEIMVKAGVDASLVDGFKNQEHQAQGSVKWDNETSKVDAYAAIQKKAQGLVDWANNTANVKKTFNATGTISWTNTTPQPKSNMNISPANGTAHSKGTAYYYGSAFSEGSAMWQHYRNASRKAYAGGNWGLNQDANGALLNELGGEIIVRNGEWFVLNNGYPTLANLKRGDIIFNHQQSEQILKNGFVTGSHGKLAYSGGSAFSSGGGGGQFWDSSSGSYGTSHSSSSKKKKKSSSSKSDSSSNSADKEAKSFMEKMKEYFDGFVDWIEVRLDYLDRKLSKSVDKFESSYRFDPSGNDFKDAVYQLQQSISETQKAKDRYWVQANLVAGKTGLSADLQRKVQTGTIDITEYDEETRQKIEMYQEWYEKIEKCEDALDDLTEQQSKLFEANFDKLLKNYDNQLEQLSHQQEMIDKAISLTEAKGHLVGESYYKKLIELEGDNLTKLTEEYTTLQKALEDGMNAGNIQKYSESWYEMTNDINAVEEAILDAKLEMQEFENAIRDLQWDNFDYLVDKIQESIDEADFLVDLLGRKDLFDDKGILTKEGMATLGQYSVKYNVEMGKSDKYKEEIDKINESLEIDPFNKDLLERRKELLELQRESIQNAEDEKQAMIDLIKDGVEKQIEAMQNLIDAKVEALDKEKDLYSYKKDIFEKTKRLNDLEKQYNSLLGDDTEENAKTIQELKNQISDARTDLEETEYDRYISDQKDLLDELIQNYSDTLNSQFDNISFLIDSLMGIVNDNSSDINDTITSATEDVGYTITDELQSIWNSNSGLSSIVSSYSAHFDTHATTVQEYLKSINTFMQQMAAKAEEEAKANMSQQPGSSQPSPQPPSTGNSNNNSNSSTNGGGDGTPSVGDSVTFVSGKYYYDSYGQAPAGNKYMGQKVYITKVNANGSKPYHISTGNKLGNGDLGWVRLDQLKGYKSGIKSVPYDQYAWTNEDEQPETIVRKSDGAMLTKVFKHDDIYNAKATENMWDMANNPSKFIAQYSPLQQQYALPDLNPVRQGVTIDVGGIGDVVLPDVQNPKEFAEQLVKTVQTDSRVQRVMQGVTTDRLAGKSKFAVRKY